jgi:hypothetical protein
MKRPSAIFYGSVIVLLHLSGMLMASIWIIILATVIAYLARRYVAQTRIRSSN